MSVSKETRALFAAARDDAPPSATREAMWSKLELATVPAALASGVVALDAARSTKPSPPPPPPSAPVAGAMKSSAIVKAGLIGVGVGSALTASIVLVAMRVAGSAPLAETRFEPVALSAVHEQTRHPSSLVPLASPPAERGREAPSRAPAAEQNNEDDPLTREVSLVLEARQSLIVGDAARALLHAHKARELRGQLSREAISLEIRALRALDRAIEADRLEVELRVLHPER